MVRRPSGVLVHPRSGLVRSRPAAGVAWCVRVALALRRRTTAATIHLDLDLDLELHHLLLFLLLVLFPVAARDRFARARSAPIQPCRRSSI